MTNSGVYLLECPYEGVTMLKIGFSKDVVKRLKQHQTSNPYIVPLGYIQSDDYKYLEKSIHHKCRIYKLKKEWFLNKEQIKNYFKEHKDYHEFSLT
jgi:hypothetical protein